jgi:hypothetical protein
MAERIITEISFDSSTVTIGEVILRVIPQEMEPTEAGFGYEVRPYEVRERVGDLLDIAHARVFANAWTPPQLVKRDGVIMDAPITGSGTFYCYRPGGTIDQFHFDDKTPSDLGKGVAYEQGCYVFWKAGEQGLEFLEMCSPGYKPGDLITVDIESDTVPQAFKAIYQDVTG